MVDEIEAENRYDKHVIKKNNFQCRKYENFFMVTYIGKGTQF